MKPYWSTPQVSVYHGDSREVLSALPDESVHTVVTSPPYWGLRDYGTDGQMGLEGTPEEFVSGMVELFREVRRVLRDDGTLWLNMGDSYYGSWGNSGQRPELDSGGGGQRDKSSEYYSRGGWDERRDRPPGSFKHELYKPKDLCGIPWRLALALQADGWWLRQDIIWHKPNPMPESVTDRCTKAHEYIFLLTKAAKYYYDAGAIKVEAAYPHDKRRPMGSEGAWQMDGRRRGENGGGVAYDHDTTRRNKRSVWTVTTKPFKGAHFATFPPDLIEPCIKAGCPEGGTVLDPFHGSGTTGEVALRNGCNYIGIELNEEYIELSMKRFRQGRFDWGEI